MDKEKLVSVAGSTSVGGSIVTSIDGAVVAKVCTIGGPALSPVGTLLATSVGAAIGRVASLITSLFG